ncbi:MAG: tetratricopeptide repeat protein, partial [Sphingomonadaceae bacterium]
MASTPPTNEAFLREVDEELRRDQVRRAAKRWGIPAIIAIVLALAAFGGWLWWNHQQTRKAGEQGEQLVQILTDLESGNQKDVEARLKPLADSGNAGYRATAKLTLASLRLQANDTKAAAAGYKAVAEDESIAKPFRDLALIRQTAAEYDSLKPADVVARLGPLAKAGNPWFGSAGEMVAVAYLNMNKPDQAGPLFAAIAKDEG